VGSTKINGNQQIAITPPSSGPTAGVALAGLGANSVELTGNSAFTTSTGAIYFPNGEVDYSGSTVAGGQCVQIVAKVVVFKGNSNMQDGCAPAANTAVNFRIRLIQ
jgi:hypothetical protein